MAIEPLPAKTEAKAVKTVALANPGIKTGPRKRPGFTLDDDDSDYVKLLLFGISGSGKTHILAQLAELGIKIAIITTDFGDSGHITIKNHLIKIGRRDLLKNIAVIPLEGYGEVANFLKAPWKYEIAPGVTLEQFDPDILGWDGFSAFQQIDISEYVGDMQPAKDKDRGDFRESGLVLEKQDYQAIRNATLRKAQDFLVLRKPDGRPVDKIMTCLEATGSREKEPGKPNEGTIITPESYKPLLSGAGGVLMMASFDVIGRTKVMISKKDANKGDREFAVVFSGSENLVAKNRGYDLKSEEPANWKYLWNLLKLGPSETPEVPAAS